VFNRPRYRMADFQVVMVDIIDPRVMLVQRSAGLDSFADSTTTSGTGPSSRGRWPPRSWRPWS
jgi:hypothetical protein